VESYSSPLGCDPKVNQRERIQRLDFVIREGMAKRINVGSELWDSQLSKRPIACCVYDCSGGANGEREEVISDSWSRTVPGDCHKDPSRVRATNRSASIADTGHSVQVSGQAVVIYIAGDNGMSAEGGLAGTLNEMAAFNGAPDTTQNILAHLDDIGGIRGSRDWTIDR
jgi:hypothetical protein